MINLSKNILDFLESINQDTDKKVRPVAKSLGFIAPGDVLVFKYPQSDDFERMVLVVSTNWSFGIYLSTAGNMLLSCFKINGLSPELAAIILKTLYKNRRKCHYPSIKKSLISIIGLSNYRTYNLDKIPNTKEIKINKKNLPEVE